MALTTRSPRAAEKLVSQTALHVGQCGFGKTTRASKTLLRYSLDQEPAVDFLRCLICESSVGMPVFLRIVYKGFTEVKQAIECHQIQMFRHNFALNSGSEFFLSSPGVVAKVLRHWGSFLTRHGPASHCEFSCWEKSREDFFLQPWNLYYSNTPRDASLGSVR